MSRSILKIIFVFLLTVILGCSCISAAEESNEIYIEDEIVEEEIFVQETAADGPEEEISSVISETIIDDDLIIVDIIEDDIVIEEESSPEDSSVSEITDFIEGINDEINLEDPIIETKEQEAILLDEEIEESELEIQEILFAAANLVYIRDLSNGISGDDVYALQKRLAELGYNVGALDGEFGPVTKAAVLSFQRNHNLYEDGIVGKITLSVLNQDLNSNTSNVTTVSSDRYLVIGMNGQDVILLQRRLAELGYSVGEIDGVFGPVTKAAVIAFQADKGLYQDGEVGNITRNALNAMVVSNTASGASIGNLTFTRELMNGMNGSDVRQLQQCLESLGYSVGGVDGIFGSYTEAAVRAFQKDNNLYLDGIVGNITTNALNKWISNLEMRSQDSGSAELKKGMMGDDVLKLQKRLKELGFSVGELDGDFGNITESALKEFQKINGMSNPSGIVDSWTSEKLNGKPINRYGYTYLIDFTTSAGTSKMIRNLSIESEGDDVKALQQRLVDLGYLIVVPKGYFGNMTYEALVAFQKKCGLPANGIADESTYNRLINSSAPTSTGPDYTISELATASYITDKNYDREGYDIKFIIPHHMAGKMTGANCANYFVNNGLQNSANYCIGYDGDIAVSVPEDFGAWTSSWWAADEQGITIEVSDEAKGSDYIPDKAIESLIYLCVDLIQRYPSLGGQMVYDPSDKDIVIAARQARDLQMLNQAKGNILLHNWTSGGTTSCPGQDMQDKLSLVATKVNELLKNPNMTLDLSEFTKITEEKKQKEEEERLKQEQEAAEQE